MADRAQIDELREFIYLDDQSINGHLASNNVGLETGIEKVDGSTHERRGRFFSNISIPGVPFFSSGGEAEQRHETNSDVQTQIDITGPYRFQTLVELIRQSDEPIHNGSDGMGSGDVIQIEGTVEPMALFRYEMYADARGSLNDALEALLDAGKEIDEDLPINTDEIERQRAVADAFIEAAEHLNDKRVPVRLDTDHGSFGISINREWMRVPESFAFSQPRRYTIFGIIDHRIGSNDSWEPTDITRLLKHFSEDRDELVSELQDGLKGGAEGMEMVMNNEHLSVDGPAKVIHPIAIYR